MTQVMTSGNQKRVTEFLFSVFPHLHECALLLFIPLLLIYGLIITGNLMIFIVIQLDMILNTSHVFLHQCPLFPGDLVYHDHHPQDALLLSQ